MKALGKPRRRCGKTSHGASILITISWKKQKTRAVSAWIKVMFLMGLLFLPAPLGLVVVVVDLWIRVLMTTSVRRMRPTAEMTKTGTSVT